MCVTVVTTRLEWDVLLMKIMKYWESAGNPFVSVLLWCFVLLSFALKPSVSGWIRRSDFRKVKVNSSLLRAVHRSRGIWFSPRSVDRIYQFHVKREREKKLYFCLLLSVWHLS